MKKGIGMDSTTLILLIIIIGFIVVSGLTFVVNRNAET